MGADSSTLQSIESLNSTLEDIEKKLFVIEDVHLHHERTIAHDDSVLISGKKIGCRSGVRLVCGPILGAVGSNYARMLVEVDYDAELTFNVFLSDAKLMCSRYSFTVTLSAKGGQPIATKIDSLMPGTNYAIYIGGITPTETVTNYAAFQTLPDEARAVRILLAHNGRVDRLMPGETNLWKEIENRVVAPQVTPPAYCKPLDEDDDEDTNHLYLSSSTQTNNTSQNTSYIPPVHLLCHQGNLISIEPIIRSRSVELLDLLVREDSNYEDWITILEQTETLIRDAFRAALTAPTLVKTLRRCGNLFLVGPEEAGAVTTALLAMNLPDKLSSRHFSQPDPSATPTTTGAQASSKNSSNNLNSSNINTDDEAASDADASRSASSLKSLSKGTTGAKKTPKVKKGKSKKNAKDTVGTMGAELMVDAARQQIVPTIPEADTAGDIDLTPVVGSAVRRFFDAEQLSIKSRSVVQENLRRLLAGLLVRSIRRISRSYLRQLWDENYHILATEDAEKELFFRSMLRLQKVLQVKTHMRSILESSRLRLLKEFGAENKALDHLTNKSTALGTEIASLEMELRQAAERSGELAVTATAQPNGGCLQLGTLGVVLIESSWGWLGRDDQLLLPMVREVEIHEQIQQQLEQMLVPTPPRIAQHLDDDAGPSSAGPDSQPSATVGAAASTALSGPPTRPASALSNNTEDAGSNSATIKPVLPVQAVLCLSTCPLLPYTPSLQSAGGENNPPNHLKPTSLRGTDTRTAPEFVLSTLDVRRVLQVLAKWQQESPDRAVLLSGPAGPSVDAAQGYAAPFAVTSTGQEITSDAQFDDPRNVMLDVWNRDRSKLQQVLVGDLSRANRATAGYFQDLALLQAQSLGLDALAKEFTVTDTGTQFKSYYDRTTQCVRRCFWDVCFSPQLPPILTSESVTGVRAAPPASFVTDCVTDNRRGQVTFSLGPVVGAVTATSANVLVQVCETAPLELICVDQVTGAEYLCSRLATAHRPCLFEFEHLLPNHAYDLVMLSCTGAQGGPSDTQCVLWGSFTTLCAPRVLPSSVFSGGMSDANVVHSLRQATGGGGGNSSVAGSLAISEDEHHSGRSGNHASSSIRLLLLGADKPSWRSKLTSSTSTAPTVSLDRQNLARGVSLCQEVSNCLAQGWNGVDLVIHCGLAVDWGTSIDGVLNLLTQAETLQGLYTGALSSSNFAVQSNHLPVVFAPGRSNARPSAGQVQEHDAQHGPNAHSLLLQAFDLLRSAYVKHWGASPHSSNLLAHGNHYFLSAPVFDVLALFHVASLRDLRRDLSPYCVQHLTQFITQLHLEYQQQLSYPAQSIYIQQAQSGNTGSIPYLKLLDGGAVALFELQPNFSFQQDSFNRVSDHLLSPEQVQALDALLFPNEPGMHDHPSSSQPRTFAKSNLTTLVLLSPIPLVLDSDVLGEFSHLNAQHKGVRFAHREVLQLLDLLSQWVEVSPLEREVLVIAGGVATSFITTIHCEPIVRPQALKGGARRIAATSAHSLHQEPSIHSGGSQPHNRNAAPATSVKIRQMCCGALVGVQEDTLPLREGVLHSTARRFKLIHRTCANGTGAEVAMSTGETRPHTAATSGTAAMVAAAEAARLAEYFPQCGLVEILTTESRRALQVPAAPVSPHHTNILHEQHPLESPPHEAVSDGSPVPVVPAPAVLKFLDQGGLKAYFSHGWPALMGGTESLSHNKISTGIKGDASIALSLQGKFTDSGISERSLLQHSRIQSSASLYHLATELQSLVFVNAVAQGPEQAFVADIKRAMEAICQRERTLFEDCHRIFLRHDAFPLPVNGNYNVEKSILSMTHWIITRMSAATRNVCKVPSSFMIRLIWEHYEREAEKLIKPSEDNSGRHIGENVVAEFVCASLAGDVDYFVRLLKNCMELQLIQEYMAYSRGLLDGAIR